MWEGEYIKALMYYQYIHVTFHFSIPLQTAKLQVSAIPMVVHVAFNHILSYGEVRLIC